MITVHLSRKEITVLRDKLDTLLNLKTEGKQVLSPYKGRDKDGNEITKYMLSGYERVYAEIETEESRIRIYEIK